MKENNKTEKKMTGVEDDERVGYHGNQSMSEEAEVEAKEVVINEPQSEKKERRIIIDYGEDSSQADGEESKNDLFNNEISEITLADKSPLEKTKEEIADIVNQIESEEKIYDERVGYHGNQSMSEEVIERPKKTLKVESFCEKVLRCLLCYKGNNVE
jgi:hypothetical protein